MASSCAVTPPTTWPATSPPVGGTTAASASGEPEPAAPADTAAPGGLNSPGVELGDISDDLEIIEDAACRLSALEHGGHDQIRAAHHVPAGEHFGMRGLKGPLRRGRHAHASARMQLDAVLAEPRRRARLEAKGHDDGISGDDLLGAGHVLGQ